ncbi:MAG: NTP transferase domain-containing protein [Tyzzerella sp.]|nr:NTP transferase domain-containing protein [Tyzzerella sp.]MBQ4558877.1 NTP transferase domain-containing protein [Tyzzerella sp.]
MNLTLNQFEVLTLIEKEQDKKITQRDIAQKCHVSLGIANKTLAELTELELVKLQDNSKYTVTLKGYEWLEPYRVKKAIFMAAGFGSRMVPVTLNTPKPLIQVHGKRIIETLLDAVLDAGITDITIVRGYLGEQFDLLLKKYPMIKFVENPIYNEANNISSAYVVRDMLANAYVLESDLLLYNKNLIRKYEYTTNYLGMPVDRTDDWCFETKKGYITKVRVGGEDVHHMFGISYWTREDAEKMEYDIEKVYKSPGGKERYWDEVALRECIKNYKVWVRTVEKGDIIEIDTYNELKQIDSIYNV